MPVRMDALYRLIYCKCRMIKAALATSYSARQGKPALLLPCITDKTLTWSFAKKYSA